MVITAPLNTVRKVKRFAIEHRHFGGGDVLDNWKDEDIQAAINDGMTSRKDWREFFFYNYLLFGSEY